VPLPLPYRPTDAPLSVPKAARLLGVHPNTIRAWSDAGRLRYYRINPRGDRRYRLGDLQRFMAAAETGPPDGVPVVPGGTWGGRRTVDPAAVARFAPVRRPDLGPARPDPLAVERHRLDLEVAASLARLVNSADEQEDILVSAAEAIRGAYGHHLVAIWELCDDRLSPRAQAVADAGRMVRLVDLPRTAGLLGRTLDQANGLRRGGRGPLPAELIGHGQDAVSLAVLPDGRPELAVADHADGGDARSARRPEDGRDPVEGGELAVEQGGRRPIRGGAGRERLGLHADGDHGAPGAGWLAG